MALPRRNAHRNAQLRDMYPGASAPLYIPPQQQQSTHVQVVQLHSDDFDLPDDDTPDFAYADCLRSMGLEGCQMSRGADGNIYAVLPADQAQWPEGYQAFPGVKSMQADMLTPLPQSLQATATSASSAPQWAQQGSSSASSWRQVEGPTPSQVRRADALRRAGEAEVSIIPTSRAEELRRAIEILASTSTGSVGSYAP